MTSVNGRSVYVNKLLREVNQTDGAKKVAVAAKNQLEKVKHEMIIGETEYTKNKGPIACDKNGVPSIVAELGYYLGQQEGMDLLRRGIHVLMVNFAFGDPKAQKLLFETAPHVNQLDVSGLVGHIVGHQYVGALSPAELRRIEKDANTVVDIEPVETREQPVEVVHE